MKNIIILFFALLIMCFSLTEARPKPKKTGENAMTITVTSPSFKEGEMIDKKFTCVGANITPELNWSNIPATAKSIALIVDDPDAPIGIFTHWVVFNIPTTATGLKENSSPKNLPTGAIEGKNSADQSGYYGPCPPSGVHRYIFKVYALDATLPLTTKTTKEQLVKAMSNHIIARGELMGKFTKVK
jgi:Raf kinase inhibitor-like YbhB/YbcL family protein